MKFEYALATHQGSRERNEDRIRCFQCAGNTVAVVADGMGGHGDGDLAAEEVVNTIEKCFKIHPVITEDNIIAIMDAANQNVVAMQTQGKNTRATVVALFISEERMIVAHAGDSRMYAVNGYKTLYRTKDHSVTQMAVNVGEISEKGRKYSADRNRVLKSMGNKEFKISLHVLNGKERKAKGYILCTDGFWEHFEDRDIRRALRRAKNNPQLWIDNMIKKIEKETGDNQDNYSAITLMKRRAKDE